MVNPYESSREAYEPIIVAEVVNDFDYVTILADFGLAGLYVIGALAFSIFVGSVVTILAT